MQLYSTDTAAGSAILSHPLPARYFPHATLYHAA